MSIEYIREAYAVPAKIRGRVKYKGIVGTIVGVSKSYLRIRLDGEDRIRNYHPTYLLEYLEDES